MMNNDDEQTPLFELGPVERAIPVSLQQMHLRWGRCAGHQCGDCQHYIRYKQGSRWAKCNLTRITSSVATDWHAKYEACGRFEDNRN